MTWVWISYALAVAGAILGLVAHFINYITLSGFFFSRKTSIVGLIIETFDHPYYVKGVSDKIVLGMYVASICFSFLTLITVSAKKMSAAIVFAVIAVSPFLMIGTAYVHYAASIITVIGSAWYKIAVASREKYVNAPPDTAAPVSQGDSEAGEWICPNCSQKTSGSVCEHCGSPK